MTSLPWIALNAPGYARFRSALSTPETIQRSLLRRYLRDNAGAAFGRTYRFADIRTPEAYQSRVPLSSWEDVAPWVDRIAAGEPAVLTRSPVRTLEPTSGSSSAAKRIPYTAEMQREIRRAVAPWIFDLYKDRPRLARGCAYWSITPVALDEDDGSSAVRVGFEEDAEYLGGFWRRLVDSTLAVPGSVRHIRDMDSFRYVTLLFLLRRSDLSLISAWHPSFLTLLMGALPESWDRLIADIERGTLTPPYPLSSAISTPLASRLSPLPRRAAELRRVRPDEPVRIWPRLGLLSCWGDAHAALHLPELRRTFPGVEIQPKGLLATEAFVTIPFAGKTPLAIRSHFFEFLPEDGERPRFVHELEPGGVYSVVVTTGGGLYRYRLGDRVEVTGFAGRTPSLRFLGREGHTSDLRGEKLHEGFVAGVLERVFRRLAIVPRFALLAPDVPDDPAAAPGYVLYLEVGGQPPTSLARILEEELEANPHYRAAVTLGQLTRAKTFLIEKEGFSLYLQLCRQQGQRLGDVKPMALSPWTGWRTIFPGRLPP
ncbi:MAG TPA: GH3 auxin-responsive promoter family protein [Thermoanaerobaculia bacterium]|nr:GH3 auxin-responsive promoter family protein [Thermoanaerobaculia bacterium]